MTRLLIAGLVAASLTATAGAVSQNSDDTKTSAPIAIKQVRPRFPPAAMKEGVTGTVLLDVTVMPDGSVGNVRVRKSLSPRLDAEAVRAGKQWQFKPGTKNGTPVAVETQLEMTFTVR